MSAFADREFASDRYHSARPRYPQCLYNAVFQYQAQSSNTRDIAIDIACGTGEATIPLAEAFGKVIGIDSSAVMIESARKAHPEIRFEVSSAETFRSALSLSDHSLDLITIAEAIHWFDLDLFYKECHRALKPNSTLAFWGYCDAAIEGFPEATDFVLKYCYGDHYLGPYWQQPGRDYLRDRIPNDPPASLFTNIERYENIVCRENKPAVNGNSDKFVLSKETTVGAMAEYVRTWSAYHSWRQANPHSDDIVVECFNKLKNKFDWTDETRINLTWDSFLVLARSK